LGKSLRASDVLARLGGDEFAVILFNNDAKDAEKVALKLQEALNKPLEFEGSIGHLEKPRYFAKQYFPIVKCV